MYWSSWRKLGSDALQSNGSPTKLEFEKDGSLTSNIDLFELFSKYMGPNDDPKEWTGSFTGMISSGLYCWLKDWLLFWLLLGMISTFIILSTIYSVAFGMAGGMFKLFEDWRACGNNLLLCFFINGSGSVWNIGYSFLLAANPFFKSLLKLSCFAVYSWLSSISSYSNVSQWGRPNI